MTLPTWQEKLEPTTNAAGVPILVPLNQARKFFAVDNSGSTTGSRLLAEADIVRHLHGHSEDYVALWNTICELPLLVSSTTTESFKPRGGTYPQEIMRQAAVVEKIWASDVWILCTDGAVYQGGVSELTRLAESEDVLQIPVIVVIVGEADQPCENANLSVGVSFYACAKEAAILYKHSRSGQISVINAKGRFTPLLDKAKLDVNDSSGIPGFHDEQSFKDHCEKQNVRVERSRGRQAKRAISLGTEWDTAMGTLVNVMNLLEQPQVAKDDLVNLLKEEAFNQLALVCKTRGQLGTLRDFLLRHKQQEIVIRLEDRHGATEVMEKMVTVNSDSEKSQLAISLREAHAANRKTYLDLINEPSDEARVAKDMNRMLNRALATIADFEKSGYTADILNRKSNRARRAEVISVADAEIHLSVLDLSDEVFAYRAICPICCGDEQIMSIVLKSLDTVEENTTDFALNFPLAAGQAKQNANMISSQCVCFQCASLLPRSIHRETICAVLPAVRYQGENKRYINHQLTQAVTAGLATGVSGIVQMFATILDRTLETKEWCSAHNSQDHENLGRRELFEWVLQNLLQNLSCRETFNELGPWVEYPRALDWAANEYTDAGLDSWIIQYPLAGFNQLLRWYEILPTSITTQQLAVIKKAKLVHLVISTMMSAMLKAQSTSSSWKHAFLALIYQEENAPGIPRDIGPASMLSADSFWSRLENALGAWSDVQMFLTQFDEADRNDVVGRLQILVFWVLFTQKGHTTPKTFFATIRSREELGLAVLDPTKIVPENAIQQILYSIFCPTPSTARYEAHLKDDVPRFVSPFGASVLRCGKPGCPVSFYSGEVDKDGELDTLPIRTHRAQHLNEVHAVNEEMHSETGLPEATIAPKPPTSYSLTLHLSTAKVWSRLGPEDRQGIAEEMGASGQGTSVANFVTKVRSEICAGSRRGNIYSPTIDEEIREVLPSFLEALRVASKKEGLEDESGLSYSHDWTKNTVAWKAKYELCL